MYFDPLPENEINNMRLLNESVWILHTLNISPKVCKIKKIFLISDRMASDAQFISLISVHISDCFNHNTVTYISLSPQLHSCKGNFMNTVHVTYNINIYWMTCGLQIQIYDFVCWPCRNLAWTNNTYLDHETFSGFVMVPNWVCLNVGASCIRTTIVTMSVKPTNDPKDAQDVGGKDDQQVDESEQNEGDGDVARPVEGLVGEHHLLNCSPYLFKRKIQLFHCILKRCSYRMKEITI